MQIAVASVKNKIQLYISFSKGLSADTIHYKLQNLQITVTITDFTISIVFPHVKKKCTDFKITI